MSSDHYNSDEDDDIRDDVKSKGKVVSKKEYDELSKLCDKLLNQQGQLENELKEQASYIKVGGLE